MEVLKVSNLTKKYGNNLALNDFSLTLNSGNIVALLGPNGAGKTTFVKSILGLLNVDNGEIEYFGNIDKTIGRDKISYLPEKFTFYSYFNVESTLRFYANMYKVQKSTIDQRISDSLAMLSIVELRGKKLESLSKGQMQRVGLACSIIGDHELIVLDEPFSGLDPIGIKEVKDLCQKLKAMGKTLIINSHILAEMEKMADIVIIINKGNVLAQGSVKEVRGEDTLENCFFNLISKGNENA